eukprot:TRINITY_DN4542_c0_g3_i1.p1 TRINITY_DN4542_c0_g3~~TRINITY_DN4542_c0_g3_i1.p1  ORF type:complete len:1113 (+),score=213.46 TRINITY_DN4542_c0_g3_i1:643-3981(+)
MHTLPREAIYVSLYDFPGLRGAVQAVQHATNLFYLRVESFRLAASKLSGTLPSQVGPNFMQYSLGHTRVSGTLPVFPNNTWRLFLKQSRISGTIPRSLLASTRLQVLHLPSNPISGHIPADLASMTAIEELLLNIANISGTIPSALARLSTLTWLYLSENHVSGTLPAQLVSMSRLEQIYLGQNSLSGAVPEELWGLPALSKMYLSQNSLVGTLGRGLASASMLQYLFVDDNALSGTLAALCAASALQYIDLSRNVRLSGTINSNVTALSSLTLFMVRETSVSGSIPSQLLALPQLSTIVINRNRLSGTLPDATQHSTASSTVQHTTLLDVSGNALSGTIGVLPRTQTLTLSNNRISGTLPGSVLAHGGRAVLLNDLMLSGTLPVVHPKLLTLSLARNRFEGTMEGLERATSLTTLIVSGNYLSCQAARLDGTQNLSVGVFSDPVTSALKKQGTVVELKDEYSKPFATVIERSYQNIALAFAGNQLTTEAAYVPMTGPGRLRRLDEIQRGRRNLFSGDAAMWQLLLFTLPLLFTIHALAVLATVRPSTQHGWLRALKSYFSPPLKTHTDTLLHVYTRCTQFLLVSAGVGVCLTLANWCSAGLFHNGCTDRIFRGCIASIRIGLAYEWCWVFLNVANMLIIAMLCENIRRHGRQRQARNTHKLICGLARAHCDVLDLLRIWRANLPRNQSNRHMRIGSVARQWLFYALHIPLLCVASLPACGYVLSQNVSLDSWWLLPFSNTVVVAVVKTVFSSTLVPFIAERLARLKYGLSGAVSARDGICIDVLQTQAGTAMIFDVITVLVAPMLAVLILDESCLRYYLYLSPTLHSLLDGWSIGQVGISAYRPQFCSRKLVYTFAYVWLTILSIKAFFGPAAVLLKANPTVARLHASLSSCSPGSSAPAAALDAHTRGQPQQEACRVGAGGGHEQEHEEALAFAGGVQKQVVSAFSCTVICVMFGVLVPPLLLLAPLVAWLTLCAITWESRSDAASFGLRIARGLLVRPPVDVLRRLTHCGSWVVSLCLFVDLEFHAGPVIGYFALGTMEVVFVWWSHRRPLVARAVESVDFRGGGWTIEFAALPATERTEDRDATTPAAPTEVKFVPQASAPKKLVFMS